MGKAAVCLESMWLLRNRIRFNCFLFTGRVVPIWGGQTSIIMMSVRPKQLNNLALPWAHSNLKVGPTWSCIAARPKPYLPKWTPSVGLVMSSAPIPPVEQESPAAHNLQSLGDEVRHKWKWRAHLGRRTKTVDRVIIEIFLVTNLIDWLVTFYGDQTQLIMNWTQ